MEVCNCHTRNMSFLDEIFGTDGRKHNDEGIWNWVKNQRNKRKLKKAEKLQQTQTHALNLHSHSTIPASSASSTFSSVSNNTRTNAHSRSHSVSSAATASMPLYYCSPRSPTSTFTPSSSASSPPSTAYSSPRDSLYFRRPASVNSSTTSPSTLVESGSGSSPKTHRLPYTHSRQRAQSTFTLPAGAMGATVDSTKRYVSSRHQHPQHYTDDYHNYNQNQNQTHNLHSHYFHGYYDDEEGPIRRSASSRSAPTHYYSHLRPQQQEPAEYDDNDEESNYASLCDIDSLSISASNSSSGNSNKGKGVQRDQEVTIDELTEVNEDDDEQVYSVVMDSNLPPRSSNNNSNNALRRAASVAVDGSHGHAGGVVSTEAAAGRRRSESTHSPHHNKEDGWWWE